MVTLEERNIKDHLKEEDCEMGVPLAEEINIKDKPLENLPESSNGKALIQHFEDHQKEGLIWYFCHNKFEIKGVMMQNMRTHTEEKPYQCTVCDKRFSRLYNVKKHRDIHEDRRPELCTVCSKTFRQKHHLKTHMRTHTGERPYKCISCGKTFRMKHHLKTHMLTHTGERPYKCIACGQTFRRKDNLKRHMKTVDGSFSINII